MIEKGYEEMKPKYLYHGSQYKFNIVKPMQASGNSQDESLKAIYTYDKFEHAIPFALPIRWYPDNPDGVRIFTTDSGRTYIEYGTVDPNAIGYIYKLPSDSFYKIINNQWVSESDVIPVKVYEIKVSDYWDTIKFSSEAEIIQRELYGDFDRQRI